MNHTTNPLTQALVMRNGIALVNASALIVAIALVAVVAVGVMYGIL